MDLSQFGEYGLVGVCLALIGALIYLLKVVLKIVGNHINHNTDMMSELKAAIAELTIVMRGKK